MAVLLGYALLDGIGGGLVYLTCVATVADWFSERSAPLVGVVSLTSAVALFDIAFLAGNAWSTEAGPGCLDLVGAALTGVMRQPGRPTLPVLPRGRADRP